MSTQSQAAEENPEVATYDLRGAAAYLKVGHTTIARWVNDGLLPAQRVGPKGKYRIRRDDLDTMVRAA